MTKSGLVSAERLNSLRPGFAPRPGFASASRFRSPRSYESSVSAGMTFLLCVPVLPPTFRECQVPTREENAPRGQVPTPRGEDRAPPDNKNARCQDHYRDRWKEEFPVIASTDASTGRGESPGQRRTSPQPMRCPETPFPREKRPCGHDEHPDRATQIPPVQPSFSPPRSFIVSLPPPPLYGPLRPPI